MDIKEFYKAVGGDYDEVVARLQSDALIKKFVLKFAADPSYSQLEEAKKAGDISEAFRAAHTIKGVAATLGFTKLAAVASALTEELRPLKSFPPQEYFIAVDEAYGEVIAAINKL